MAEKGESKPLPAINPDSIKAFERYLDREPLNEELAEIRAGKTENEAHPVEITAGSTKEGTDRGGLLDWRPSRKQLVALSEIVDTEGWTILQTLLKKRLEILRETAITVSQNDPLQNKDVIANEWAYHGLYGKALSEMEPIVREQLDRLKVKE